MRYAFLNNFSQLLAADLAAGATTLTLDGGGSLLSNASADLVYTLTLVEKDGDGNEIGWEVVHVTGATGNDLTVVREQEGTTALSPWPTGTTVEMRVTAGVMSDVLVNQQPIAWGDGATADESTSVAIGEGASTLGGYAVSLGWGATVATYAGVSVGAGATSSGDAAVAIGDSEASAFAAVAIGSNADAQGSQAAAIGYGSFAFAANCSAMGPSSSASGADSSALGYRSAADAAESIAIGAYARARDDFAGGIVIGSESDMNSEKGVAVGYGITCGGYQDHVGRITLLGSLAAATSPAVEGVALGYGANVDVPGGMRVHGLPYLPAVYTVPAGATSVNAVRQSSSQVTIATQPLDLTSGSAAVTVDLPAGTKLFIDAIDVVITGSDTPGGTPEISVGPDDVTPAAYLPATPVGKTAVGGRETHSPLVSDGVTSLRAATTTAGTGTTYQAKVIIRGYVMEL